MAEPEKIPFDDAVRYLGIDDQRLHDLVEEGYVRGFRNGESIDFRHEDLTALRAEINRGGIDWSRISSEVDDTYPDDMDYPLVGGNPLTFGDPGISQFMTESEVLNKLRISPATLHNLRTHDLVHVRMYAGARQYYRPGITFLANESASGPWREVHAAQPAREKPATPRCVACGGDAERTITVAYGLHDVHEFSSHSATHRSSSYDHKIEPLGHVCKPVCGACLDRPLRARREGGITLFVLAAVAAGVGLVAWAIWLFVVASLLLIAAVTLWAFGLRFEASLATIGKRLVWEAVDARINFAYLPPEPPRPRDPSSLFSSLPPAPLPDLPGVETHSAFRRYIGPITEEQTRWAKKPAGSPMRARQPLRIDDL